MSEDIEKHILRKYEVSQKLGKGVRSGLACAHMRCVVTHAALVCTSGVRHCMEGC